MDLEWEKVATYKKIKFSKQTKGFYLLLNIKIKIINPKIGTQIPLPEYKTSGSAGMDVRACLERDNHFRAW